MRGFLIDITPLKHPAFRRLWIGQSMSAIGIQITVVAVSVQVYEITRSSFWVGLLGLANLIPLIVFGLWGGAVADAVDRRRLLFAGSLVAWLATGALVVQAALGLRSVGLLMTIVVVHAAGSAVAAPTRGAIIPRILSKEQVPAANTLNFSVFALGTVLGPMAAGIVLAGPGGYAAAYAADAVLFTAILWAALRLPPVPPLERAARLGLRAVGEGLRYLVTQPVLLMSFVVDIIAMVLAFPRALFPEAAATTFSDTAEAAGWLFAAMGIGAAAGGLFSGWIGRVNRQGLALIAAIVVWGLAVAVSGLTTVLWATVALLALGGAADMVSGVYRQTILQTYAPDEMRGRLQGVFIVVVAGGPRLGELRSGAMAEITGPVVSWVGGGIACAVLVVVAGLLVPSFRTYRRS